MQALSATAISTAWRAASGEQAVGQHRDHEVGAEQRAAGVGEQVRVGEEGRQQRARASGMARVCSPSRRA